MNDSRKSTTKGKGKIVACSYKHHCRWGSIAAVSGQWGQERGGRRVFNSTEGPLSEQSRSQAKRTKAKHPGRLCKKEKREARTHGSVGGKLFLFVVTASGRKPDEWAQSQPIETHQRLTGGDGQGSHANRRASTGLFHGCNCHRGPSSSRRLAASEAPVPSECQGWTRGAAPDVAGGKRC